MLQNYRVIAGLAIGLAAISGAISPIAHATGQTQTATPPPGDNAAARGIIVLRPTAAGTDPAPAPSPGPVAPAPQPAAQTAVPAPAPVVKDCARPFAHSDVTLAGSGNFRNALRRHLARKAGAVIVNLAQPFAVTGTMPEELAPWVKQVKKTGGKVSVDTYCQDSRGLFSMFHGLFDTAAQDAYAAADGYDAVLHVDGLVGAVTQVEFRPRATS